MGQASFTVDAIFTLSKEVKPLNFPLAFLFAAGNLQKFLAALSVFTRKEDDSICICHIWGGGDSLWIELCAAKIFWMRENCIVTAKKAQCVGVLFPFFFYWAFHKGFSILVFSTNFGHIFHTNCTISMNQRNISVDVLLGGYARHNCTILK